jgi:hypothetical protein
MSKRFDIGRITSAELLAVALGAVTWGLWLAGTAGPLADVIKGAAQIKDNYSGLGDLVATVDRLVEPATIAVGAVMPLALLGGLVGLAFGARGGLKLVLVPIGVLIGLGSLMGFVK